MSNRLILKPYSVNGIGIRLLDYQRVSADTYEVTRWLTLFFVPVLPLGTLLIKPGSVEGVGTSMQYSFQYLGKRPTRWARVFRLYGFTLLAALPITAFALLEKPGSDNPNMSVALVILSVLWAVGILWYGQRGAHTVYHAPATQDMPTGGAGPRKAA